MNSVEHSYTVRVLIVDDSPILRKGMRAILEASGAIVVGECSTGLDVVEKVGMLRPDVITMDLDMPKLDGLATIERIMADRPTPILVVTGDAKFKGLDGQFEALTRGAVDIIAKPSTEAEALALVDRLRMVARIPVVPHVRGSARRRKAPTVPLLPSTTSRMTGNVAPAIIAIGASTGGPGALRVVLSGLGADPGVPVLVVQHMAEEFAFGFIRWLRSQVAMPVYEATPGTEVMANTIYVAARGPHLRVGADRILAAVPGPPDPHRPSIDTLFSSLASAWGRRSLGILLTGMGDDGATGLGEMYLAGALTIAQDEDTSVVFGMPAAAIERNAARLVLALDQIARVSRDACAPDRKETR